MGTPVRPTPLRAPNALSAALYFTKLLNITFRRRYLHRDFSFLKVGRPNLSASLHGATSLLLPPSEPRISRLSGAFTVQNVAAVLSPLLSRFRICVYEVQNYVLLLVPFPRLIIYIHIPNEHRGFLRVIGWSHCVSYYVLLGKKFIIIEEAIICCVINRLSLNQSWRCNGCQSFFVFCMYAFQIPSPCLAFLRCFHGFRRLR